MDGKDNSLRFGMPFMSDRWTLEVWAHSDTAHRKSLEYIVGGGEWNDFAWVDNAPLVLRDGHLHATFPHLTDAEVLDSQWHHVALTCDGKKVTLYRDGQIVAQKDTAYTVLPGMLGSGATAYSFSGDLDELRIWRRALSQDLLRAWMNRPLSADHPYYLDLAGYYPLDDLDEEMAVNWVGRGFLPHHLRNGRLDAYGKAPLACAVPNENPKFSNYTGLQRLFNAVSIQSEWDCDAGSVQQQMVKLRIAVQGEEQPLRLTGLTVDMSETQCLKDIEAVHIYATGQKAASEVRIPLMGGSFKPAGKIRISVPQQEGYVLQPGINYFLVTFDVSSRAELGHQIGAQIVRYELNGISYMPETTPRAVVQEVTANNVLDENVLKVLQWNIWHGGLHLGNNGQERTLQLIRHSSADLCLMQEAYGIQPKARQYLPDYRQWTYSEKDNLCLFSRLPMANRIPWREPFKSAPAIVTMRNGHRVLAADIWVRYATDPSYTDNYYDPGQDTGLWIRRDSAAALADTRQIIESDVYPYLEKSMSVLIGGDFNSCSHLDWTSRTARFHYGYGEVCFPTSRYLQQQGFTDSFRYLHPDEVCRPEGTWANMFGHSPYCRIDFIYSKGVLQPLQSKVVRTHPEIDFVWTSDHCGMMSVFRVQQ